MSPKAFDFGCIFEFRDHTTFEAFSESAPTLRQRDTSNFTTIASTMPDLRYLDLTGDKDAGTQSAGILRACRHLVSFACTRGLKNLHAVTPTLLYRSSTLEVLDLVGSEQQHQVKGNIVYNVEQMILRVD
ncbi:hypothetical protein BG000_006229 [Podila horticola]|nr:hypothetical protein BG000_006229 [Podila horticola]